MLRGGLGLTLPVPTLLRYVGLATAAVSENVCSGEQLCQECGTDPLKPAAGWRSEEEGSDQNVIIPHNNNTLPSLSYCWPALEHGNKAPSFPRLPLSSWGPFCLSVA